MTHLIDSASATLMAELATSTARSFLLSGIAVGTIAIFRLKATSQRLFVWTSVLYASLGLPLLGWLVPALQIRVPGLVQSPVVQSASSDIPRLQVRTSISTTASHAEIRLAGNNAHFAVSTAAPGQSMPVSAEASGSFSWAAIPWSLVAPAVYLTGTSFLFLRFLVGILLAHRIVREAKVITELFVLDKVESRALSAIPHIAMSERISVPITVGVFRATILLPVDWREWDEAKLRAVLAHEGSHVARRDPLTQSLALVYRAFFWFSPLSWWLHQQLETLAEQASDEAALAGGADQKHYARTLLGFFEAFETSPGRVRWQGVSMARVGQAERRLERILNWKGTVPMRVKRSFAVATLVLAIPVVVLVAAIRPVSQASAAVKPAAYQAAPSAPSMAPVGGVAAVAPVAGVPAVAAVPTMAPVAPWAPMAPIAPQTAGRFSYSYGYDDDERFVIASGNSDSYTMSGSTQDVRHVEKLKKTIPGDFIWFQRDEESYIIRDQATIDRARKLFAPQEELGKKQEELGKQQEALGKQQEELGKKMEQVRINVPDMTAELDRLKAKLQKLGPSATMEQIGDLQSEIGDLQSKIGELQGQAGEEQGKLGELQGELGEKQGKLGEQQGELGRQQGELAEKATREMKQLLDEAIKKGTAKPERDTGKGSL